MTDRYAVIGNPVGHSQSPRIHAAFARQTGQDLEYGRLLGEPGRFAEQIREFLAAGGKGLNVTLPFKGEAWRLADESSPRAEAAQAVNTLIALEGGRLRGDNTDGVGLVRDLEQNWGYELRGKRLLLLGAGGAAQGVVWPLLERRPERLLIANRTPDKARELVRRLASPGALAGCGFDDLVGEPFDLILNATSAGIGDRVPQIPDGLLTTGGWCYDLMYGDLPTAFVRWGLEQGAARAVDGLGMLVEQAAESFFLWRGVRPRTAEVIAELRAGTSL